MKATPFRDRPSALTTEMRWRHRFAFLTVFTTFVLIGWGAFVTSIGAGLAVPDWPTTFNSYDPFNPWPGWWTVTPVLAEHGHRLIGALVGLFTLVLAIWTWFADHRSWVRFLGLAMLVLVITQGVIGGLRVVWVSLDLAVVHASLAQIFLAATVGITLFTSRTWLQRNAVIGDSARQQRISRLAVLSISTLFVQIILGALLRHPGSGIDPLLVILHIAGGTLVLTLLVVTFGFVKKHAPGNETLRKAAFAVATIVVIQFILGFAAYFVTLDGAGMLQPSNLQVIINSSHVVVGALLMATVANLTLLTLQKPSDANLEPATGTLAAATA
jgi:heme a synthase